MPSQVMEHWCAHPDVLKVYAKHYKTGEVIPQDLVDKLKKSSHFNQGFITVEYLAASFLDMNWHTLTEAKEVDTNKFESDYLNNGIWGLFSWDSRGYLWSDYRLIGDWHRWETNGAPPWWWFPTENIEENQFSQTTLQQTSQTSNFNVGIGGFTNE